MPLSRLGNCPQRKVSNPDMWAPLDCHHPIPSSNENFPNSLKYSLCSSRHGLIRVPHLSPFLPICPLLLLFQPGGLPSHIFLCLNSTQTLQFGSMHPSMRPPHILWTEGTPGFPDPFPKPDLTCGSQSGLPLPTAPHPCPKTHTVSSQHIGSTHKWSNP